MTGFRQPFTHHKGARPTLPSDEWQRVIERAHQNMKQHFKELGLEQYAVRFEQQPAIKMTAAWASTVGYEEDDDDEE